MHVDRSSEIQLDLLSISTNLDTWTSFQDIKSSAFDPALAYIIVRF